MDYTGDKGRVTQPNANRYRFNNGTLIVGSTTSSGLPGAPWNSGVPEAPISGATPWWNTLNIRLFNRMQQRSGSFYYHLLQSAENAGFKTVGNYSACHYLEFLADRVMSFAETANMSSTKARGNLNLPSPPSIAPAFVI